MVKRRGRPEKMAACRCHPSSLLKEDLFYLRQRHLSEMTGFLHGVQIGHEARMKINRRNGEIRCLLRPGHGSASRIGELRGGDNRTRNTLPFEGYGVEHTARRTRSSITHAGYGDLARLGQFLERLFRSRNPGMGFGAEDHVCNVVL